MAAPNKYQDLMDKWTALAEEYGKDWVIARLISQLANLETRLENNCKKNQNIR